MKKNKTLSEADEASLSYEQVQKLIGKKNMVSFLKFMAGQTCCVRSDGRLGYYPCDVDMFKRLLKEKRALSLLEWD